MGEFSAELAAGRGKLFVNDSIQSVSVSVSEFYFFMIFQNFCSDIFYCGISISSNK